MRTWGTALALMLAVGLLGCGGGEASSDGDSDTSGAEESGSSAAEEWWFEVDVAGMEIPRVSGTRVVVVRVGPMNTVRGSTGSPVSHLTFSVTAPEPGTYPAGTLRMQHGDDHVCAASGTVEVESTDPLVATLSGEVECWAGTSYGPEDPNNPGRALEGAKGKFTAGVRED